MTVEKEILYIFIGIVSTNCGWRKQTRRIGKITRYRKCVHKIDKGGEKDEDKKTEEGGVRMLDRIKNKTNATIKKLLTLVMALAMTITCIPTMAFAAENSEQVNKNLKVLVEGDPEEVITEESIRELYGIELGVTRVDGQKFVRAV